MADYFCPECSVGRLLPTCSMCGSECARVTRMRDVPKVLRKRPDLEPLPAEMSSGIMSADLKTAVSDWVRGLMLREDPDCPELRSAQAAERLWTRLIDRSDLTAPPLWWDRRILYEARQIFGHHFRG